MSASHESLSPDDRHLESQLGSMPLMPLAIDRDRLMYEAGWRAARAQGRWSRRAWPVATVLSAAASVVLAVIVALPDESASPAPVAIAAAAPADSASAVVHTADNSPAAVRTSPMRPDFRLADIPVMAWRTRAAFGGLDVVLTDHRHSQPVTSTTNTSAAPASSRALLNEWLNKSTDKSI